MRKRNLIFPLVVSSLFMPSIEALDRTTDLNSLENENNIYEAVDILIAEGGSGGGGEKASDKKANDLKKGIKSYEFFEKKRKEAIAKGKSTTEIDKKIEKWKEKIIKLDPDYFTPIIEIIGGGPNSLAPEIKETQDNKTDKKLLKEIVEDRRKFIEAERKDPGLTYFEIAKDKVSNLIKKTAASNPSTSDDFFEFSDKKWARVKELELIKNFIDIVVYENVHSGKDFVGYSPESNKKLPRKLQLRKQIYEKQLSLVSKINREQYSEEIRIILYNLVEGSSLIKLKMMGIKGYL